MHELTNFLAGWEKVRENTVATAQEMPEEHYDTTPCDGVWSFRNQLTHILNIADVLVDAVDKGEIDRSKFGVARYARTKAELIAALQANFRAQKQQIASRPDAFWALPRKSFDGSEKTAGELLQMLKEHEIAHCNQLYIYLRAKGIVPSHSRKKAVAKTQ